ncbi:hypothetical protein LPJ73_002402 [Coemansia sp. RSA 2703]|nr:hypothetical protein LPJ73_002402 [Coemansia sp. RSA 2703]KAJ2375336.1 hypothetical protein IW150_002607 [Coemansia sp. RSA 2607]KAJ2396998.1 hypothetical protein GGI05_000862 [Coemansia sp. RSA 2603]
MMMPTICRNIAPAALRTRMIVAARLSTTAGTRAPTTQHHGGNSGHHDMSPQDVLDKMHPKRHGEILSSMLDGELDYDTDMGAAAVNNVVAEERAESSKKAEKIARDTYDDFAKRHF